MDNDATPTRHSLTPQLAAEIDAICDRFESEWKMGVPPALESYLDGKEDAIRELLFEELLSLELAYRARRGEAIDRREYLQRFAGYADIVTRLIPGDKPVDNVTHESYSSVVFDRDIPGAKSSGSTVVGLHIRCPHCHNPVEIAIDISLSDITCSSCGSHFSFVDGDSANRQSESMATIGHFVLLQRIGIGGFGTVWKAHDTRLDRTVAVKIPRRGQLQSGEFDKFVREARAAAQLNHPNIVSVHEVGRDQDTVYIVTDIVQGVSLSNWMNTKQPTPRESVELCVKTADALQHAHLSGVVHRDLKPQNILVDSNNDPHLTDFGLAKRESGEITVTLDGQLLGTPAYMSPEQARGASHDADGRSDIYSLGVILYQLLTGELPFRGKIEMLIHQVLNDDPTRPRQLNRNIPRDLETVTLKCLEKDPARRYQTASELKDDLQRFLRHEPVVARPLGNIKKMLRWCRRNRAVAVSLASIASLLLLGATISTLFAVRLARSEREKTEALSEALLSTSRGLLQVRQEGYREEVWSLIRQIQQLGPVATTSRKRLRDEIVATLGDFVGLRPIDHSGFAADIDAIALSPSSKYLAIAVGNRHIRLSDPLSGTVLGDIGRFEGEVIAIAFPSSDDRLLAVERNEDNTVEVQTWNRVDGGEWRLEGATPITAEIDTARFISDGQYLVGRSKRTAIVWDSSTQKILTTIAASDIVPPDAAHRDKLEISSITCTDDGRLCALGYAWNTGTREEHGVVLWDIAGQKVLEMRSLNLGWIYRDGIALNADGSLIAVGSDHGLTLYDIPGFTQRTLRRIDSVGAVAFCQHDQTVVSADIRGTVKLWSVSTGNEVAELTNRAKRSTPQRLVVSRDGKYLASANVDNVRLWSLLGAKEKLALEGHQDAIHMIAFSPDGNTLASGGSDRVVNLWNADSGKLLSTIKSGIKANAVAISPDGQLIAIAGSGAENSPVQIWSLETLKQLAAGEHQAGDICGVTFANNRKLAAAGFGGVAVWDLPAGLASHTGDPVSIKSVAIAGSNCLAMTASANGHYLAWPHDVALVRVWDIKQSKLLALDQPEMLQGWHGLAFVPDASRIIFVGAGGSGQKWDFTTNRVTQFAPNDTFGAPHLALSHDGKWLAALASQDTVVIWNTNTDQELYRFRAEMGTVWALAWSPDGSRLAVGLNDGSLLRWDMKRIDTCLIQMQLK